MNLQAGYSDNDDNNNSNGIDMVVMHIKFKKDYQNFTYDDSFTNFFNRVSRNSIYLYIYSFTYTNETHIFYICAYILIISILSHSALCAA